MVERALLLTDGNELVDPFGTEEAARDDKGVADLFQLPFKDAQRAFERQYLEALLIRNGGNRKLTAEQAGIDPATLFRKLKRSE
jgi:DNA-binding NtrC family response regulator